MEVLRNRIVLSTPPPFPLFSCNFFESTQNLIFLPPFPTVWLCRLSDMPNCTDPLQWIYSHNLGIKLLMYLCWYICAPGIKEDIQSILGLVKRFSAYSKFQNLSTNVTAFACGLVDHLASFDNIIGKQLCKLLRHFFNLITNFTVVVLHFLILIFALIYATSYVSVSLPPPFLHNHAIL